MRWPLSALFGALASPALGSAASCAAAPTTRERELCLRVKESANQVRSRLGHVPAKPFMTETSVRASSGKGSMRSRSFTKDTPIPAPRSSLAVVLPVVRRKQRAELAYVQRSVPALVRELANQVPSVLVFGDRGEAASIALRLLEEFKEKPVRFRFQARGKHKKLKDPAKLKKAHGDSQEKILWRSRLVLDFVSAAHEALASAPNSHLLWVEDDVELLPGFGALLQDWLQTHGDRSDWLVLRLLGFQRDADRATWAWGTAGWGGGGTLLYNAQHLQNYLDFLEANFDAAPLDWLHRAMPPPLAEWWQPQLQPVLLRHFGEHSTHENFL